MVTENPEHQDEKAAADEAVAVSKNPPNIDDQLTDEAAILEAIGADDQLDNPDEEPSGFANPLEALAADLDKLETENAELKDQLLRSAAEMQNLRRRTQKDIADARSFSISGFARDMLAVSDNLHRALEVVSEEDKALPAIASFTEGVEITEKAMLNALEKNGVRKITPQNEKFDPNFHQAMFEIPNTDLANNTDRKSVV